MNAIFSVVQSKFIAALSSTALLLMFANSQISTAPEKLWERGHFPDWLWVWQVHAWRLFISSRTPQMPPANTASVIETHSLLLSKTTGEVPNEEAH